MQISDECRTALHAWMYIFCRPRRPRICCLCTNASVNWNAIRWRWQAKEPEKVLPLLGLGRRCSPQQTPGINLLQWKLYFGIYTYKSFRGPWLVRGRAAVTINGPEWTNPDDVDPDTDQKQLRFTTENIWTALNIPLSSRPASQPNVWHCDEMPRQIFTTSINFILYAHTTTGNCDGLGV